MTNFEIANIIGEFTTRRLQPEDYDSVANFAQGVRFRQCLDEGDEDSLRPFKVSMGTDNDSPPLYVSSLGISDLPSDYYHYRSLTHFYKGVEYNVEVLDDQEFDHRKSHRIEVPTGEYPVACFRGVRIYFQPKTLQYVNMDSVFFPPEVHFAVDKTKGWAKYDATNSVEFMWDDRNVIQIIIIMLQSLGITANEQQVKDKMK